MNSGKLQITDRKSQVPQRGYMMITLMLFIALTTIALLAVLPDIKQQIRRDREEELVHRGTAYMRAIQHYYKKFGRYPNKVEDLENTNNMRFLRKRYTDPVNRDPATGKERDFKFLHQQDIALNNGPVLGQTPGMTTQGQLALQQMAGQGGLSQSSIAAAQNLLNSAAANPGNATSATPTDDSDNSKSGSSSGSNSGSSSPFSGPTFGGGPILGVASLSKEKTIRVFFDKSHYKDWLFFYMPMSLQQQGLLTGPVNPNMPAGNIGGLNPNQLGTNGQPGTTGMPGMPGGAQGFGGTFGQGTMQPQAPSTPVTPPPTTPQQQ